MGNLFRNKIVMLILTLVFTVFPILAAINLVNLSLNEKVNFILISLSINILLFLPLVLYLKTKIKLFKIIHIILDILLITFITYRLLTLFLIVPNTYFASIDYNVLSLLILPVIAISLMVLLKSVLVDQNRNYYYLYLFLQLLIIILFMNIYIPLLPLILIMAMITPIIIHVAIINYAVYKDMSFLFIFVFLGFFNTLATPYHIQTIIYLYSKIIGLYMFSVIMSSLVNIFNAINFNKTYSIFPFITTGFVSLINVISAVLYLLTVEEELFNNAMITINTYYSIVTMLITVVLTLLSILFMIPNLGKKKIRNIE